jgi:hypothetical protein
MTKEQFLCPFEEGKGVTGPLNEMLEMKRAFYLEKEISDSERRQQIIKLLTNYVVPCFDMYQTEVSVRRMMGDYKAPLRAQMFGGCPKEWWPKD